MKIRWQVTRSRGRLVALGAVVAVLLGATAVWVSRDDPTTSAVRVEEGFVEVPAAPGSADRVSLETSLFLPERTPAPAVLLAHGFGGDKHSVDTDARELAEAGFVVQSYSA
ncbi:MAG: ABC transporter ATP-binding protein, partial [Umezawaea sp.]